MRVVLQCFVLAGLLASSAQAAKLDEILSRQAEAVGGSDNWAMVDNVRIQLDIKEPTFEVTGTYVATRDGEMRIDIRAGGERVFSEGLHQGQAWEWRPAQGRQEVDEVAAATLRHGIDMPGRFYTMEQARSRGAGIEQVPSDEAEQLGQWQLRVTLEDGFGSDFFIDKSTALVVRARDFRAFHVGNDPTKTEIETRYQGALWIDGVLRSSLTENHDITAGKWLGTTEVRSVEHNIDIPEGYFAGDGLK
jgi:hypothetical protein